MKLTDGKTTIELENENHIAAFLGSGWVEAKEEKKPETVKKSTKK